jgi:hypothetical protein
VAVINDIDESLRSLLRSRALSDDGAGAEVVFDAPVPGWRQDQRSPVVDLHLYDVTEDVDRRPSDWEDVRDAQGRRVGRRPPLRLYLLSYALTAWGTSTDEEHRLLSQALTCLAAVEHIPAEYLSGALRDATQPVSLSVALPQAPERRLAVTLHGQTTLVKPVLHVVVGAPLQPPGEEPAGPLVRERRITLARPGAEPELAPTHSADLALVRGGEAQQPGTTAAARRTRRTP